MKYNPRIHNRQSIRLKGYDYARAGLYFITICCQDRAHLFGHIKNGEMVWNEAGKIANECWLEIPNHFPNTRLHEHIIMPDHVHGIIEIIATGANHHSPNHSGRANIDSNIDSPPQNIDSSPKDIDSPEQNIDSPERDIYLPRSPSQTIGSIIRGFKIGVTKWMRKNTDVYSVWQRNYWDHIIRNEGEYQRISQYIINNPKKWEEDKLKR